jgi:hypothetical protein
MRHYPGASSLPGAGKYYVKTACPKDYRHSKLYATSATRLHPTTQVSEAFDVSVDRATTGINAGCYKPTLVEGVVFSDKNTNSVQEEGTRYPLLLL